MALSRTDRERLSLVIATLALEAKQAGERASTHPNPFPELHWRNQCTEAATTLRELIERRERREKEA